MAYPIRSLADLGKLNWQGVPERLQYVSQALRLLKAELGDATALIGFAGSPWTLANFMVEGGSAVSFQRAQEWLAAEPNCFHQFLEKLTAALVDYLRMQIDAGVDALQIFDTLGGLLDEPNFAEASARWMGDIVRALGDRVPVIVFSRRPLASIATLTTTNARVLSFDGAVALREVRQQLPSHIGIQGNLAPALREGRPDAMVAATSQILQDMQRRKGFIFNLGHGLPPKAPIENVKILVETVKNFAWQN